jgi:hypothetical protein
LNISDNTPDDETDEEINDRIDEQINNYYEVEGSLCAFFNS